MILFFFRRMTKRARRKNDKDGDATTAPKIAPKVSRRIKRERNRQMMLDKKKVHSLVIVPLIFYSLQEKRERREANQKLRAELGDKAPLPSTRTIENTREYDVTTVAPEDEEVVHDELHDEMASYFNKERQPKILITMTNKAKLVRLEFCCINFL